MPEVPAAAPAAPVSLSPDDILSAAVAELQASRSAPAVKPADPVATKPEDPPADPAVVPEPKVEAKPPEDAETARRLSLIAKREGQLRAEAARREGELAQRETALKDQMARVEAFDALKARAAADPMGVLRSLGLEDFAGLAEQAWAEKLGEQAPPELKQKRLLLQTQREVENLKREAAQHREKVQQYEHQQRQGALLEQARGEVETQLADLSPALAHVKAFAAHSAKKTSQVLLDMAMRHRQANPHEPAPSISEMAERLEKALADELAPFKSIYAPKAPPETKPIPPVAEKQTPAAPRTLTNDHATRTASRVAPKTLDELMEEAVAELRSGRTSL